jgi:hypothetical protein
VDEWLSSQVAVDERRHSTNSVQPKPQHQIFRAIPAIECNDFIFLDIQIVHEPVANSLEAIIELPVGPLLVLEDQEDVVGVLASGVVFNYVVGE